MSFIAWKRFKKSLSSTLFAGNKSETNMEGDEGAVTDRECLSPCSVVNVRPEFVILDLTVKLKELVNSYEVLSSDETDLDDEHTQVVFLNMPAPKSVTAAKSTTNISNTADLLNRQGEIETKMYEILGLVHHLCLEQQSLEGCVLRELRHLQDYVLHRYPSIAEYLRTPFMEVIECVQSRTKGLSLVSLFRFRSIDSLYKSIFLHCYSENPYSYIKDVTVTSWLTKMSEK